MQPGSSPRRPTRRSFPRDLVARLQQAVADEDADMACAASGGRHHPVFGLWPVALGPDLRHAMTAEASARSMRGRRATAWPSPASPTSPTTRSSTSIGPTTWPKPNASPRREPAVTRKVIGIAGYKKSGKTTLVERLVAEFTARGLAVATVKHAHHAFDIDHKGRDSWRHRAAGSHEVAIVSDRMWAIIHPLHDEPEPALDDVLAKMAPSDLVIVEGYKRESYPKIEVRGPATNHPDLAPGRPDGDRDRRQHRACARHRPGVQPRRRAEIADFITAKLGLAQP
jgi:molybdopterin-guanine dinucleotide biosynthesis adapter protein